MIARSGTRVRFPDVARDGNRRYPESVAQVLDLEQALLLLELEPPFDKRAVQMARRRDGQAVASGHRAARSSSTSTSAI